MEILLLKRPNSLLVLLTLEKWVIRKTHSTSKEIIEATARKARVGVISTCRPKPQPKFYSLHKLIGFKNFNGKSATVFFFFFLFYLELLYIYIYMRKKNLTFNYLRKEFIIYSYFIFKTSILLFQYLLCEFRLRRIDLKDNKLNDFFFTKINFIKRTIKNK